MPTIPDNKALSRVVPRGPSGIATINTSGAGDGARALAGALDQVQDTRARFQASRAQSEFMITLSQQARALENDPDYESYDKRFISGVEPQLNEAASSISDPYLRQEFLDRGRQSIESTRARVSDMAWGVERDTQRRAVDDMVRTAREEGIASGNVVDTFASMERLINDGANVGYFSQEEAGNMIEAAKIDYATGYLESLPASERLDALTNSEFAAMIPTDRRAFMERQTRDELLASDAMVIVDGMINDGVTLEDLRSRAAFQSITDPDLRAEVERRFEIEYNRSLTARSQERDARYQDWYSQISLDGASFDDIPKEQLSMISQGPGGDAYTRALQAAELTYASKSIVYTNQGVLDELYVLRASPGQDRGDRIRAAINEASTLGLISNDDYNKWSEIAAGAEAPIEIQGMLTANQMIDDAATNAGINTDEDRARLRQQLNSWYMQYQQINGQLPDDIKINNEIMNLVKKQSFPGWRDSERTTSQILEEEGVTGVVSASQLSNLRRAFQAEEGRQPTREEITELIKAYLGAM